MSDPFLFGDSRLPDDLDASARSEVKDGEQLLWVGQPRPRRFAREAIFLVPFGILVTPGAIGWTMLASRSAFQNDFSVIGKFAAFFLPLIGLLVVLVGLEMISSPLWLPWKAKRTCYALTDRRAILWEGCVFGRPDVRSYRPADLTKIIRKDCADGSGDLVFEEPNKLRDESPFIITTAGILGRGFLGIDNVREIEELLRKALLLGDGV